MKDIDESIEKHICVAASAADDLATEKVAIFNTTIDWWQSRQAKRYLGSVFL